MAHELSLEILQHIRQSGQVTRAELAQQFRISQSLISKRTTELLELGLVNEISSLDNKSGRPAGRLIINPRAGYAIGLDIGGRHQVGVVTDLAGEIITAYDDTTNYTSDRPLTPSHVEGLIHKIVQATPIPQSCILGLGVGIHDIVDSVSGVAYGFPSPLEWSPTWVNYPFRDALAAVHPFPHILVDDIVRALGVAEAHYGRGIHEPNFVYVLADHGIGMAIMLNGIPFIGASHIAGEIAHIPVGNQPTMCRCGNTSCLGILSGIDSVIRQVKQRLKDTPIHSSLRFLDEITFDNILEASGNGDKLATQVLMEAGEYMGMALAVVLNLFGAGQVIMGGGLAHSTAFCESARRLMHMRALEMAVRGVELETTSLDNLAGARGAATLVLNALFEPGEKNLIRVTEGRGQTRRNAK